MLELLARSGGGRILQWTRGDHTLRTPIVLAPSSLDAVAPAAFGTLAGLAGPATERRPLVVTAGGFHVEQPGDEPTPDVWGRVVFDRPRRILGQLALRGPLVSDDDEDARAATTVASDIAPSPLLSDPEGELAVFGEAASCARDPARLIPRLLDARDQAGPARVLYAPGIGLVHLIALLTYAGVDLFDTLAVQRATLEGHYLTAEGVFTAETLAAPLCACATCATTAPREMTHDQLLAHNLGALDAERTIVTGHLQHGTLRELVEQRARAHPGTAAALRHLDRHWEAIAAQIPLSGGPYLHATTMESLQRPDIERYRARIRGDYQPPQEADILLLLPCSAVKPYSRSKSHSVFRRVLTDLYSASLVHEVIITSPMGVVPRELESTWPAGHYDVPVTGVWDREEREMIREQVRALLAKGTYRHVVAHLGESTYGLVADLLPEGHVHTGAPHPTDYAARDALRRTLKDMTAGRTAPAWPKRRLSDAHAVATWQFGRDAADALFADAGDVSGRPPMLRIYVERGKKGTIATFVPDKGIFSLTMEGARRLYDAGCAKTVEIDDFTPRGTLFAVGVRDADPRIIPGDEVVITHNGTVRGVGSAIATGKEMREFRRGGCVEVRHHA